MTLIVAPTEPLLLRNAASSVSLMPEQWGCDVLIVAGGKKVGVQRKEIKDLLSSTDDGRLALQLSQMRASPLDHRVIVLEGGVRFDNAGRLDRGRTAGRGREWTQKELWGLLWSVTVLDDVTVVRTDSVAETVAWVKVTEAWWSKTEHKGLRARPGMGKGAWGKPMTWEWASWVLQGWPGIGPELAERIVREFGRLPLKWDVTVEQLSQVKGISKARAEKWIHGE